jgi:hypothetical protein
MHHFQCTLCRKRPKLIIANKWRNQIAPHSIMKLTSGYANPVGVLWVFITDQLVGLEPMLRQVSGLIRGVSQTIGRIVRAFAAFEKFMIDLKPDKRSAFAVFPYCYDHAHAPDSTPVEQFP